MICRSQAHAYLTLSGLRPASVCDTSSIGLGAIHLSQQTSAVDNTRSKARSVPCRPGCGFRPSPVYRLRVGSSSDPSISQFPATLRWVDISHGKQCPPAGQVQRPLKRSIKTSGGHRDVRHTVDLAVQALPAFSPAHLPGQACAENHPAERLSTQSGRLRRSWIIAMVTSSGTSSPRFI